MSRIAHYNSVEASNLALGQGGYDILPATTNRYFPGGGKCEESIASHTTALICDAEDVDNGVCDETEGTHTTKTLCDNENGGADPHTTDPGLPIHWDYDQHKYATGDIGHFKGAAKRWVSVKIIGDGVSTITLTPHTGDEVTITATEQDSLIGVTIQGNWASVIAGGSGSNLLCVRG